MNADKYWQKLVEKNPALGKADDEKVTLTVRGLRNVVKQAHETGYKDHIETQELRNVK